MTIDSCGGLVGFSFGLGMNVSKLKLIIVNLLMSSLGQINTFWSNKSKYFWNMKHNEINIAIDRYSSHGKVQ